MSQAANKKNRQSSNNEASVEVLYQRLGNKWFAFSLIDDEVFVGSVPDEAINGDTGAAPRSRTFKNEGNS